MTPLVVVVEDLSSGARTQYAFFKSPVRIGRSEINDLPLPQPFVSNWHAVVQFDEHGAQYVDLGSTNGSIVSDARLEKNVPVTLGAEALVQIGGLRLEFSRRALAAPPPTPRPATMFAMRAASLASMATPQAGPAAQSARPSTPAPLGAPSPGFTGATPDESPLPALTAPDLADLAADPAVEVALEEAGLDLDLLYASYRGTWEHLRSRIERVAEGLDAKGRTAAARRIADKYPELALEPQFREMAGLPAPIAASASPPAAGVEAAARAGRGGDGDAALLLRTFAESYLPASVQVGTRAEVESFLGRLAEALETFARSYVEMRKGYEEFGKEMGVRTVQGDGPVERARDARQLMAYLLDPAHPGRAGELRSAFADLMLHQVALLSGVTEGAKALLKPLSPDAIQAEGPQGIWPMKAQSLWKTYEARFHEVFDEDSALSDALFGKEFAKAYTAIVGKRTDGGAQPSARRR